MIIKKIENEIEKARKYTEDMRLNAMLSFINKNFVDTKRYSAEEIRQYPVAKFKDFFFRVNNPFISTPIYMDEDPFAAVHKLKISNGEVHVVAVRIGIMLIDMM
ncbi:MAG: hypothetical protein HQK53_14860 [Oligoflexia bacterium]|nr:hypothetical protein [Oligoflexia bacterium]